MFDTAEPDGNAAAWIGGSDKLQEGSFKWLNGTPLPPDFPWKHPNPSNSGNEDCLEALKTTNSGTINYNDNKCGTRRYFVCEM